MRWRCFGVGQLRVRSPQVLVAPIADVRSQHISAFAQLRPRAPPFVLRPFDLRRAVLVAANADVEQPGRARSGRATGRRGVRSRRPVEPRLDVGRGEESLLLPLRGVRRIGGLFDAQTFDAEPPGFVHQPQIGHGPLPRPALAAIRFAGAPNRPRACHCVVESAAAETWPPY
jgi:hypothetical protein